MPRRLRLLLIVLAAGLTLAACGDDNKKDSSSTPAAQTATTQTDTTQTPTATTSGGSTVPGSNGVPAAARKRAEQACKQTIQSTPQLKANVKSDLEKICVKAANGDEAAVKKAAKQICVKIVEAGAPAGPARDSALQGCNQAGE